jgi:serine/threonine protein phosphatase PrpC
VAVVLSYAARSDVGLLRKSNQDSGYAGPHLLAVADGMGGAAGGDIASSVVVAHLAGRPSTSHTPSSWGGSPRTRRSPASAPRSSRCCAPATGSP